MLSKMIPVYLTKDSMPNQYETVIIEGGIGEWNGQEWKTLVGEDSGRTIIWPVIWWSPLLYLDNKIYQKGDHSNIL